jgi:hypothetical protein
VKTFVANDTLPTIFSVLIAGVGAAAISHFRRKYKEK